VRVAILFVVLLSGCIIPFATPPLKGEIGASSRIGHEDERNSSSLHAAAGTHLASGTMSSKQPFDVGAGWTFEKTADSHTHGLYVDGAFFVDRFRSSRTSVGARGEMRWLEGEGHAYAAKLRAEAELFSAGSSNFESNDHCGSSSGTHYGTGAIGLFVEAGHVWEPQMSAGGDGRSGGNAWVATAGITVRIPSAVGVWIGIPYCK
jgi:hypothetical protein